jgi:hypothetical protein
MHDRPVDFETQLSGLCGIDAAILNQDSFRIAIHLAGERPVTFGEKRATCLRFQSPGP